MDQRIFSQMPSTIDEVLSELDRIIEQSRQENDYIGLFAYVYRRTTAAVRQGIEENIFEDGDRMERFDVLFANLYIQAYRNFFAIKPACQSWTICFEARFSKLTVMQHVMMGMNAHINLDLGIAAASTSEGRQILQMKDDFMKVNEILNSIIDDIQASLSKVSPFLFLIDWLGGRKDEKIIDFGIRRYRDQAWHMACELALANDTDKELLIAEVDEKTTSLGRAIQKPPRWWMRMICHLVGIWEEKNTATILDKLSEQQKSDQQIVAEV
jgi:hypothetical protein